MKNLLRLGLSSLILLPALAAAQGSPKGITYRVEPMGAAARALYIGIPELKSEVKFLFYIPNSLQGSSEMTIKAYGMSVWSFQPGLLSPQMLNDTLLAVGGLPREQMKIIWDEVKPLAFQKIKTLFADDDHVRNSQPEAWGRLQLKSHFLNSINMTFGDHFMDDAEKNEMDKAFGKMRVEGKRLRQLWADDILGKAAEQTKEIIPHDLDFSAGDFFPAILKDNRRAPPVTITGSQPERIAGAAGLVKAVTLPLGHLQIELSQGDKKETVFTDENGQFLVKRLVNDSDPVQIHFTLSGKYASVQNEDGPHMTVDSTAKPNEKLRVVFGPGNEDEHTLAVINGHSLGLVPVTDVPMTVSLAGRPDGKPIWRRNLSRRYNIVEKPWFDLLLGASLLYNSHGAHGVLHALLIIAGTLCLISAGLAFAGNKFGKRN